MNLNKRNNYRDLTGQTINNLFFIKDSGERTSSKNVMWEVRCYCGKIFLTRANRIVRGVTKSCGCYQKQQLSIRRSKIVGPLHPLWNPNKTEAERLHKRPRMKKWRNAVYKRDNYTCQCCNKKSAPDMVGHHLDGWHWCEEGRYDVDNGITLCGKCHNLFHKIYGKGNNTRQQFEEFLKERVNECT